MSEARVWRHFLALSITFDNEEDNIKALMTFSSSPTTTAPSHVSTAPQHVKNKDQKCKMFHSKPKSYAPLTKKPSSTAGTRSNDSSMEKQLSPRVMNHSVMDENLSMSVLACSLYLCSVRRVFYYLIPVVQVHKEFGQIDVQYCHRSSRNRPAGSLLLFLFGPTQDSSRFPYDTDPLSKGTRQCLSVEEQHVVHWASGCIPTQGARYTSAPWLPYE